LYDNSYITIEAPLHNTPKEQHLLTLNKSGFISKMISLDLKGVIASQISECNEIILTEIITNKHFLDLSGPEIVAVLAAFIEEKTCEEVGFKDLTISENAKQMLDLISYIADDFGSYEYNSGINIQSDWKLYLSFVGPAFEWANMVPLHEILAKNCDIYEGTFIRNILRIYNMVENIKNIMEILDQPQILKKLEGIDTILIRDQVTTTSLYIDK
jgi:superfamily II RNA helicase